MKQLAVQAGESAKAVRDAGALSSGEVKEAFEQVLGRALMMRQNARSKWPYSPGLSIDQRRYRDSRAACAYQCEKCSSARSGIPYDIGEPQKRWSECAAPGPDRRGAANAPAAHGTRKKGHFRSSVTAHFSR